MSEVSREEALRRGKPLAIGCGVLAGVLLVGSIVLMENQDKLEPDSAIVANVPGQVEGRHSDSYTICSARIKQVCGAWATHYEYYLKIEQSPRDVEAAKEGRHTESFDPKVGEVYPDSVVDDVQVDAATWSQYALGSTITFSGDQFEHLKK